LHHVEGIKESEMKDLFASCLQSISANVKDLRLTKPSQAVPSSRREVVDKIVSSLLLGHELAQEYEPDELAKQILEVPGSARAIIFEGAYTAVAKQDIAKRAGGEHVGILVEAAPGTEAQLNAGLGALMSDIESPIFPHALEDSFFGWIALQGRGARDGYYRWTETLLKQEIPACIPEWGRQAYDEGVGGGIWYVGAAEPKLMRDLISSFPPYRRFDLWAGVGYLIGMWGLHDEKDMRLVRKYSGAYREGLWRGLLMGTAGCMYNKVMPDHLPTACEIIMQASCDEIYQVVGEEMQRIGTAFTSAQQFSQFQSGIVCTVKG